MKRSALDQVIVALYLTIMGIGLAMKRRAAQGMSAVRSIAALLKVQFVEVK